MLKRLAFVVGAVLAAAPAFSQNSIVAAGPGAAVAPGNSGNATVTLSSNVAGGVAGAQFRLCFDPTLLTAGTPTVAAGLAGVVCAAPTDVNCPAPTTRGISCSGFSGSAFTLPAAVTFPFTVAGGAAVASTALTIADSNPIPRLFDQNATAIAPLTVTSGTFNIAVAATTPPNLTYNPSTAAGVTFPSGTAGAANASITVTPGGGSGSGAAATTTLNGCTASAGFTISNAPINFSFVGNTTTSQSINLSCTRGGAAQNGTLSCSETQGAGAAATRTWNLTCPQAVVISGPTLAYNPATPGPVAFGNVTIPANSVQNIVVTPSGGAGGGTTTLGACTIGGTNPAEFALVSTATLTFTAGVNTAQNLGVRFTPALPVGAKSATLNCTETVQNGATTTRTWNLTGTSIQAAAQFSANPAPPGPVAFGQVVVGQNASRTIVVTNPAPAGAQTLPLTGCAVANAPGVAVSPTSLNLAPGASGNLVLTYSPGAAGSLPANATLTCTDPLSFEATRTWNLTGTAVLPAAVPTLGGFGLWAMLGLMLGTGLVVVATRKQ